MDSQAGAAGAAMHLASYAESPLLRENRANAWAERQGEGLLLDLLRDARQRGFYDPSSQLQHQKVSIPNGQASGKVLADVRASQFSQSSPARSRHQRPHPVMTQVFSATLTALHTVHNNSCTRRPPQNSSAAAAQLRAHLKSGQGGSRAQGSNSHAHTQGARADTAQQAAAQRQSQGLAQQLQRSGHMAHMAHMLHTRIPTTHPPAHSTPGSAASTGPKEQRRSLEGSRAALGQSGYHLSLFHGSSSGPSRWQALTSGKQDSLPSPAEVVGSGSVHANAGIQVLHNCGSPQEERAPPNRSFSAPQRPLPASASDSSQEGSTTTSGLSAVDSARRKERRSGFTPSAKEVMAGLKEEAKQLPEGALAALAAAAAVDEFINGLPSDEEVEPELMEYMHSLESALSGALLQGLETSEPSECGPATLNP